MPETPFDLAALLEALETHQVRFVLIGGLAMAAHGSSHVTQDIDIAYDRSLDNYRALAAALSAFQPRLRGVDPRLPFVFDTLTLKNTINLTLETAIGDLDVLGEAPGASFQQLERNGIVHEIYGHKVIVASLDDLIAMKQAANRPKDRLHLIELEALRALENASDT